MQLNQKDKKNMFLLEKTLPFSGLWPLKTFRTVTLHNMNMNIIFNFSWSQSDQHSDRPCRINLSSRLHNKSAGWGRAGRLGHSHGDLGQLLLGEVERVVDGGDAVLHRVGGGRQEGPEDGVVGHVHEGRHGVPALVVVPHLTRAKTGTRMYSLYRIMCWVFLSKSI